MRLYVCGPMRGYAEFNFPAFFEAEKALLDLGHVAINPARHDKESGFNEKMDAVTQEYLCAALAWDLGEVCRSQGLVVLPGWHKSRGARAEVATARALGLPVYIIVRENGATRLHEAHHD